MPRALPFLACVLLFAALARAAVTYSFDWYCSGCAKLGMGSNGREGPFASSVACESARASLGATLSTRGCGVRCFNPQPCTSAGQPDLSAPAPTGSVPAKTESPAKAEPVYDAAPDRLRRADEVKLGKEVAPRERKVAGRWRNSFSGYEVRRSKDAIEIMLVETCGAPGCLRKDYPNRPVFHGRLEGSRLVGVVPIGKVVESEQNGKRCSTPPGEFPAEGKLSEDGKTISWKPVQLPVGEGCAPVSVSLGTWRRG